MLFNPRGPSLVPPGVQPQYPVEVDWSHPAAPDTYCFSLNNTGLSAVNLVSGFAGAITPNGKTPSVETNTKGRGIAVLDNANTNPSYIAIDDLGGVVADGYIVFQFTHMGSTGSPQNIFCHSHWEASSRILIRLPNTGSSLEIRLGGSAYVTVLSGLVVGQTYSVAVRIVGSSFQVWVDGVLCLSTTFTGSAGSTISGRDFLIAYVDAGSKNSGFKGILNLLYLSKNKPISDTLAADLSRDPYQIFRPAIPMPVFTAAGVSYAIGKGWTGSAWQAGALKQWNGSGYDEHNIPKTAVKKTWNGSGWV